jgi:hypothetical protein
MNGINQLLVYADKVNLLGKSIKVLLDASKGTDI